MMISVPCPLCGSKLSHEIFQDRGYDKRDYSIAECDECGFKFLNPQPNEDELGAIYAGYYGSGGSETAGHLLFRKPVFDQVCATLEPYRLKSSRPKVLDIGCGNGEFLTKARDRGWQVAGVEVSGPAVEFARRDRQIDVREGSFTQLPFDDSSFEAVTVLDVLEHLREPRETLQSVHRVLKSGGALVIRVPNTPFQLLKARLQRLRQGREFTTMAAPLHLNHFDSRHLRWAVENAGFKVLSMGPGAADGTGVKLFVKSAYVKASSLLAGISSLQTGNILNLVAEK
jgi:SAM-dependent methyltransferase